MAKPPPKPPKRRPTVIVMPLRTLAFKGMSSLVMRTGVALPTVIVLPLRTLAVKGLLGVVVRTGVVNPSRGPQPSITPPVGAIFIPSGSMSKSLQSAIEANPTSTEFSFGSGLHTVDGHVLPQSSSTGWSKKDTH